MSKFKFKLPKWYKNEVVKGGPGSIAPVWQRIRGGIAMVLCFIFMGIAYHATGNGGDQNVQIPCMVAGMLYFMTAISMAVDGFDGKS